MRICLFETLAEELEPLCLTRALFDLRCGMVTLGEKQRRSFAAPEWGALVRPYVAEITRLAHPKVPVNDPHWLRAAPTLWVNARWLPALSQGLPPAAPQVGTVDGDVAWAAVTPDHLQGFENLRLNTLLARWQMTLPNTPAGGMIVRHPWDLVDHNGSEIERDLADVGSPWSHAERPNLHLVGPEDRLHVHPSARLDPLVVIDTTPGPVVIGADAVIGAFTRIEGPCVIGPKTHVLGAKIRGGVTLGPQCRIGGEVECSIVHGFSNKYHEGFLGHSYVGEWVNLGAGTHTSDLRNDYGEVDVTIAGRKVASRRTKIGCYLGDHTKSGLGTLINTGTNVGVFCNLLPAGRLAPKYMPSFTTWWNGELTTGFSMSKLLATAVQVVQRRGQTLTSAHLRLFEALLAKSEPERNRVLRELEIKSRRAAAG